MINLSPLHTQTYNIGKVSGEKRKKRVCKDSDSLPYGPTQSESDNMVLKTEEVRICHNLE
jgi:hypothetical protein